MIPIGMDITDIKIELKSGKKRIGRERRNVIGGIYFITQLQVMHWKL
jgi:hypothetical protein